MAKDEYALWLGSGISFTTLPSLSALIERMLVFLQSKADFTNTGCPFKESLEAVIAMAALGKEETARTELTKDPRTWEDIKIISERLAAQYGLVLDQAPKGEAADYLLWEAIGVVSVYADPATEPNTEHVALATLISEGVASLVASANWDDLIEKAVTRSSGGQDILRVAVLPIDIQKASLRSTLYKFHGCAACASHDEATYRSQLVARKSQIDGWREKNKVIAAKLIDMARSKKTFMLGLSAQDTNIQDVFIAAEQGMPWSWPAHPPAYVFSEQKVGPNQKNLLRNVYRTSYPANEAAILDSALITAYAGPLLLAIWFKVIEQKLAKLLDLSAALDAPAKQLLATGLRTLRDSASALCPTDNRLQFLLACKGVMTTLLTEFREGRHPSPANDYYSPLSASPLHMMAADPQTAPSGLIELSIALGLLGVGVARGHWAVTLPSMLATRPAAVQLTATSGKVVQLFFAFGDQSATRLMDGLLRPEDDALILASHQIAADMTRSPNTERRTGGSEVQRISIQHLLAESSDPEHLIRALRERVGM